ncbi:hypothetical protein ACWT_6306 [Actinoplanes sp. SE50]|uniref:hypothetical protein n=1 Tax=unclassified Actinoplanes TaxID=2626549 RepID=UPI00023ED4DC|nr:MULTISPECIES: hypothetical protein [unclassified Actinoplanes]AEV87321.1 hypothetical protein ACPL_6439 [Actinoplanes sp. SE50/110]ATO85721.1 hypothetical protein ACWT_6306 [Actinoplanes sp. SE50]SLM03134.1 hypothetical protein ACSP50_6423 [Actinoplanes sp. SE50/110]
MRQAYAHHATLVLDPSADPRAPGAAITLALCGAHRHAGPCPVAPHHTGAEARADGLHLRILFAVAPDRVDAVRAAIDTALSGGPWRLVESGCARIDPAERDHARRLLKSVGPRG